MGILFKYKGRSFSSARSMMQVVQRDIADGIERNIRNAAISAGAKTKKTAQGLEISGSSTQLDRFRRRLEK
ncbi:hypothetical protein [Mesorhizobium sp. M7A.F.Ca.MR.362.00.0.0]|uniref:hypothetical protein n=1 Tax=Mesorhizobium sp. M7A.F.Ca.MR.362.00.0.0 TaxID=2496779 RepID=UPI000FD4C9EB|nr:hypothetical protein [Mesorhizobium sp. M7A.F.Ca.MR.362.00.0.0]RUU76228.1 hypothetical protein EOC06_27780 [Mesorhizobium sp. M7A.F.Ca.MR.362.00.0.0]RWN97477.1 MAG: hypothetical protein EOS05_05995 [Mesorhizobium sp.]